MNTKIRVNMNRALNTEMKSWKQNKMEDKKLAMMNAEVDKHMVSRRKSHLFERELVNKDMADNISKTTPTADEYLSKSQRRYDAWRMREKERLDRRYKGLYKTYLREFSDLGIDDDTLKNARKKVAAQTDSKEVSTADADQNNEDNEMDAELDAEEMDAHGELLDFNKMKLNGRRRFSVGPTSSQYVPIADDRVRRRSAGNVIPLEVLQQLRSSSMPHLEEHDSQPITNTGEDTSNTPGADNADKECKVQEESRISQYRGRRGRRASLAVTSDLSHSKEMHDIVNPGRKGRRASLAVPSDIVNATRKERRGSTEGPNFQTPTGARLSRRSSIPNIEIPMAYGN